MTHVGMAHILTRYFSSAASLGCVVLNLFFFFFGKAAIYVLSCLSPSWWRVAGSLGRQTKNKGLFSSKDGTLLSEDTAILKGDMPKLENVAEE